MHARHALDQARLTPRTPELEQATGIARNLYCYGGCVGAELEACDRILHRFHGRERNIEGPVGRRTGFLGQMQILDERADSLAKAVPMWCGGVERGAQLASIEPLSVTATVSR